MARPAYVAVGTGIGAGLVLDGQLYRGRRWAAGELGHIVVDPGGEPCGCGQTGCLETLAAGPWVARLAVQAVAAGHPGRLRDLPEITARTVYDAARDGEAGALAITQAAGTALGRAISGLVMTCDLERVLLGGGLAAAGEPFLGPILAELARLREASPLVAELVTAETVQLLPPDFDAVAWGGVTLARQMHAAQVDAASPNWPGRRGRLGRLTRLHIHMAERAASAPRSATSCLRLAAAASQCLPFQATRNNVPETPTA